MKMCYVGLILLLLIIGAILGCHKPARAIAPSVSTPRTERIVTLRAIMDYASTMSVPCIVGFTRPPQQMSQ